MSLQKQEFYAPVSHKNEHCICEYCKKSNMIREQSMVRGICDRCLADIAAQNRVVEQGY